MADHGNIGESSGTNERTIRRDEKAESMPQGTYHGSYSLGRKSRPRVGTSHVGAMLSQLAEVPYASAPKRQKLNLEEMSVQKQNPDDLFSQYSERPGSPLLSSSQQPLSQPPMHYPPERHLPLLSSSNSLPSYYQRRRKRIERLEDKVEMLRNEITKRATTARDRLLSRMAVERQMQEHLLRARYPEEGLSVLGQHRGRSHARHPSDMQLNDGDFRSRAASHYSLTAAARQRSTEGRSVDPERPMGLHHSIIRSSAQTQQAPPAPASAASAPSSRLAAGEGLQLLLPDDKALLSDYQLLIRESIEYFEAQQSDLISTIPGLKKKVEIGQVGIRCRYCAHRPTHWRGRQAVYFPGNLLSIYQAAQNMALNHLLKSCEDIPEDVKDKVVAAREKQKKEIRRSGGKAYWSATSRHVGLEEREGCSGIWFKR